MVAKRCLAASRVVWTLVFLVSLTDPAQDVMNGRISYWTVDEAKAEGTMVNDARGENHGR